MQSKTKQLNLRLTKKEKEKIEFLSKEYGYSSVSEYILKSSLGIIEKNTKSRKINTLTLNPAVDYIIKTNDKLKEISNFRPEEKIFEPGGKGINASIIINEFNTRTLAIHYSGGFSGELLKEKLSKIGIQQLQIFSKDTTRINMKLNFSDCNYELNSLATPLTIIAKNSIIRSIINFNSDEVLMIMGSFHKDDEKFIFEISKICKDKGVEIVFDLSKPILKDLVKFKPLFIKPNRDELEWIFKEKIKTEDKIIFYMKKLKKLGAQNVAITLGKDGSYLLDSNSDLYYAKVDKIELISPQGSGDSFLSAFIIKINEGSEKAFKWANAAGAATAQVNGLAHYTLIEKNLKKVHIKKL